MPSPDLLAIARRIDRFRRDAVAAAPSARSANIASGWVSGNPASTDTQFASACPNRVNWFAPTAPIDDTAVTEAIAAAQSLSLARFFFWVAPWALDDRALAALHRAGAAEVPWVKYPLLSRSTTPLAPAPPTDLTVRTLDPDEAGRILDGFAAWYSRPGADGALRAIGHRSAVPFAAFDADQPVAVALLFPDPEFAYLGFAGTQPEYRNRGAQSALIHARAAHAASQGTPWCIAETNTVLESSLRNLARQGFAPVIVWRVFSWPEP